MRRTSLVAPLLLIALGALFLARNLYPELPLLDYVAKYWPLVLIAWGVLRLLEIVVWAATSKPVPERGVSGGEWVLIVLLCIVGTSLHAVRGVSPWWPERFQMGGIEFFGERYEYPLRAGKASSPAPHIVIETFRGDAKITGVDAGSGGDMVQVSGHKTIRSLDQNIADRANEDTPLEITGDANNVVIRTHQDAAKGPQRISATLEITAPKGASVEIHGRSGDLEVIDINGTVVIDSDNAGVQLKNLGGDARLDLRRSDVVHLEKIQGAVEIKGRGSDIELQAIAGPVTIDGAYDGMIDLEHLSKPLRLTGPQTELSLEAVPGQVRMSLGDFTASNVSGPIHLSARSRDVQVTNFSGPLDVSVQRGDLELAPGQLPLGRIQARSRSGDIRLSLPPAAQFSLNASTNNGEITNDFGGSLKLETSRRRGTLTGAVGTGPAIDLETDRGRIVVRKAGASDAKQVFQKLEQ